MKRTQLYLDEEMARLLAAESRRRKTTVSELVREAITVSYGKQRTSERGAIIERLAGVWADRDDLGATEAFISYLEAVCAAAALGAARTWRSTFSTAT